MPLLQLVQQPAAGAAAVGRPAKQLRAPQQQDVCSLLVRVLLRVARGQALNLETVKCAWRELSFSHVFQAHPHATSMDQHVQLLYAAALERLLDPIPPSAVTRALQPLRAQHEQAAAAAAEAEQQQLEEQQQHEAHLQHLLLQDITGQSSERGGLEPGSDSGLEEAAAAAIAAVLPPMPLDAPFPLPRAAAGLPGLPASPQLDILPGAAAAADGAALPTPALAEPGVAVGPESTEQLAALPPAAAAAAAQQPPAAIPAGVGTMHAHGLASRPGSSDELPGFSQQPLPGPQNGVRTVAAPGAAAAAAAGPNAAPLAAEGLDLESLMLSFEGDHQQQHVQHPAQQQTELQAPPAAAPAAAAGGADNAPGDPVPCSCAPLAAPTTTGPWHLPGSSGPGPAALSFHDGLPFPMPIPLLPAPAGLPPLARLVQPQPQPSQQQMELPPLPTEQELAWLKQHSLELQAAALLVLFCIHAAQPPLPFPGLRSVGEAAAAAPAPPQLGASATGSQPVEAVAHGRGGGGSVKIYLSAEHQAAVLALVPQLPDSCPEALQALRQLRGCGALVMGSHRRLAVLPVDAVSGGAEGLAPGLFHGIHGEELSVMREVRYQLNSSLRGLGTSGLGQRCGEYQDKLAVMWGAVAAAAPAGRRQGGDREPLESIADLRVGSMLHEFTERKHAHLQLLLQHGRSGTARLLQQASHAAQRGPLTMAARAAAARVEPEQRRRGQRHRDFKQKQQQRRLAQQAAAPGQAGQEAGGALLEAAAAPAGGGAALAGSAGAFSTASDRKRQAKQRLERERIPRKARARAKGAGGAAGGGAAAGGYRGIITQVEQREQQRQQDIRRRQDAWRLQAGLPALPGPQDAPAANGGGYGGGAFEAAYGDSDGAEDVSEAVDFSDMPDDLPDMHDWRSAPAAFGTSQHGGTTAGLTAGAGSQDDSGDRSESESESGSESGSESEQQHAQQQARQRAQQQQQAQRPRAGGADWDEAGGATEATVQQPAVATARSSRSAAAAATAAKSKAAGVQTRAGMASRGSAAAAAEQPSARRRQAAKPPRQPAAAGPQPSLPRPPAEQASGRARGKRRAAASSTAGAGAADAAGVRDSEASAAAPPAKRPRQQRAAAKPSAMAVQGKGSGKRQQGADPAAAAAAAAAARLAAAEDEDYDAAGGEALTSSAADAASADVPSGGAAVQQQQAQQAQEQQVVQQEETQQARRKPGGPRKVPEQPGRADLDQELLALEVQARELAAALALAEEADSSDDE
ncbi:hypothetical protein D9Q98_008927 [Chlorella vulgaris]|uniref:Uncharacterized protein n=1 Tax=Chlorella vulgaris TaxID=3077 RepID=A0A9D4TGS6_CHLVU|nr:hypothetical protein D9Q98_008927 [Chlorella vulgaris]